MTLDLDENVSTVPIHTFLKLNYSKHFREPGPKRLIYTSDQNRDNRAKTLA